MWLLHQIRNTLIHWKNSKCSIFFPSSVRRFEECPNRQQDNFCSKCTKSFKCSSCWQVHDESFQIQIFPWKLSSDIKLMPHWWSWTDTYLNVHICSVSFPILFCQHHMNLNQSEEAFNLQQMQNLSPNFRTVSYFNHQCDYKLVYLCLFLKEFYILY